jgi:predicted hydrocarbon binding protein
MPATNNSILDDLAFLPESGKLAFKDVRYVLIRPDTIIEFQKAVEAEVGVEHCAVMMMAGGIAGGSRSAGRYKTEFGLNDTETVDFMCRMGCEIGWGQFRLLELDSLNMRLVIEVAESPFAAAYGPADAGVCHLTRGVLSGLAAGLFGMTVRAVETTCRARGEPVCRFEMEALRA